MIEDDNFDRTCVTNDTIMDCNCFVSGNNFFLIVKTHKTPELLRKQYKSYNHKSRLNNNIEHQIKIEIKTTNKHYIYNK